MDGLNVKQGNGPGRGRSTVEWGEIPSVRPSIPPSPGWSQAPGTPSQAQGGPSQALTGPIQALGGPCQALGGHTQVLEGLSLAQGGQSQVQKALARPLEARAGP